MAGRWKHHSVEEIVGLLDRANTMIEQGASTAEAIAAIGVTGATYFRWRKQYAGLRPEQLRYVKALELEVARLRRAVSEMEATAAA